VHGKGRNENVFSGRFLPELYSPRHPVNAGFTFACFNSFMRCFRHLLPAFPFLLVSALLAQPPGGGPPPGGAGGSGDGIWRRNAAFGEAQTFDACLGHQPGNGQYHYHVQPTCLRAQLGDNIEVVKNTRVGSVYKEKASDWKHSPILGWALDGYPIYGPYGYSDPTKATSAIKRVASGFRLRSITTRTSLPDWSLPNHTGVSQQLTAAQAGPAVNATFPVGRYLEDYEWAAGVGDLDQYNGRTTVTPEYPNGTYAYFVTVDTNGTAAFPYVIGGQYYGTASGGSLTGSVSPTAQDYFSNGVYVQDKATASAAMNSLLTTNSAKFAQVISGFDPTAGPMSTWPGTAPSGGQVSGTVTAPIYAEIQRIRTATGSVIVNTNGVPGYVFGPWFGLFNNGGVFGNFPTSQNLTFQFPATPTVATTRTSTGLGNCGLWVNGVAVFNSLDGSSYSNSSGTDVGGGPVAPGVLNLSGASFEHGPMAAGSIVAAFPMFAATLGTSTAAASSATWPTTLGGLTVTVVDSAGTSRAAQIAYASPTQANYVLPEATATGIATVRFTVNGTTVTGSLNVVSTYPNLFSVNATGLAAAYTVRSVSQQVTTAYQVQNGSIVPQALPAGTAADPSILVLVGSGLGSATSATATIGGVSTTVSYAGKQGTYTGLDQYNILIPASLAGKGQVDVVVTAAGKPSNTVNITLQ